MHGPTLAAALLGALALPGCVTAPPPPMMPATLGGVTVIAPRCAGVDSCLLGHVVAAESARPLPRAAVFLQREDGERADGKRDDGKRDDGKQASRDRGVRILTLTDDQGVFMVADAPPGKYRLAVYKDSRRVEVRGLDLGARGTTMVPVRLPPG